MILSSAKTLTVLPELSGFSEDDRIWIHTGAGPQMGFGHLSRCMVLARTLSDCTRPYFLLDSEDRWSREQLENQGFEYYAGKLENVWSKQRNPAAILIDTRRSEGLQGFITTAKEEGIPVLSIHDLGLNPLPSDIAIDGSIAPASRGALSEAAKVFSGADFMVLDPAFQSLHERPKNIGESIQSIVVSLGGGDSQKYFGRVLEGLRLWAHEAEVIGLRGFVDWGQAQWNPADLHPLRFRWESGPVSQFMGDADLAITAGGLSAYEALCTGTPLLALSYDSLQQITITNLAAAEGCLNLGAGDDLTPAQLAAVLTEIEGDRNARMKLSRNGKNIVDGRGAERVSQIVRQSMRKPKAAGNPWQAE